jgi:hypothetical protein
MTFLISDNDGAHRFRYFVAVLVCDFGCHVHDRQRSGLLVHDVADLRPKGQSVTDNHGGIVGEALLTVPRFAAARAMSKPTTRIISSVSNVEE